ncbi:CAT RNA binding domain-containing protein [Mycobacterium sp. MS1601]|uniref:CAT RNA binding domain-containing protein n=1 Tax=Mycobacterium sp. MS1601 TaxID=1936029 RepID=UPI0009F950BB|nr:CAT RNA binding domain-containing protein [Mycobacterium sp. MS1601]
MKIAHVFNNNAVLAVDHIGREVILTGRGIGFKARAGQDTDDSKVSRVFVPDDSRTATSLGSLIAAIPTEHLELADRAIGLARTALPGANLTSTVVATLADHLHFAIERDAQGLAVTYPLEAEVGYLYPTELAAARVFLDEVNRSLPTPLPDSEATAVALHLASATQTSTDLPSTLRISELLKLTFDVLEQSLDHPIDRMSVAAARFIAHLRYFFVRDRSSLPSPRRRVRWWRLSANPIRPHTRLRYACGGSSSSS